MFEQVHISVVFIKEYTYIHVILPYNISTNVSVSILLPEAVNPCINETLSSGTWWYSKSFDELSSPITVSGTSGGSVRISVSIVFSGVRGKYLLS